MSANEKVLHFTESEKNIIQKYQIMKSIIFYFEYILS